jgi:hypothetical protein
MKVAIAVCAVAFSVVLPMLFPFFLLGLAVLWAVR